MRKTPELLEAALSAFAEVEDPRIDRRKLHPLVNVLVMALTGVLCGATGWDELAMFSKGNLRWFRAFLDVSNGAPSADTFRRVFEALEPRELEAALQNWVRSVSESLKGEVIAIDGKSLRGAVERAGSTTPLHLLHVWATKQRLLLAQQRVEGAPGEVMAIPEVLKRVRIEGTIVTTDANGCTKNVAAAIREAKADYVLCLKGNRGPLHALVKGRFEAAEAHGFRGVRKHRSTSQGHGRIEERVVRAIAFDDPPEGWCDLTTAVMIDRTRVISGKVAQERHFYITNLGVDPPRLAEAIRAHWGIENHLHWALDVAFHEDSRRIRDKQAAENFALVARLALMMLKRNPEKLSLNLKRKKSLWDEDFRLALLFGGI